VKSAAAEAAAMEAAAMEATAMEAAAEAPTGICRGRRKGTERAPWRGQSSFYEHDNSLHNFGKHKRCRRRIVHSGGRTGNKSPATEKLLSFCGAKMTLHGTFEIMPTASSNVPLSAITGRHFARSEFFFV